MIKVFFDYSPWIGSNGREAESLKQGLLASDFYTENKEEADYFIILANKKSGDYPKNKTIHIDFQDSSRNNYYKGEFLYFKRSRYSPLNEEGVRHLVSPNENFLPIAYCVMDEYISKENVVKDINVGCYLRGQGHWGKSRRKVLSLINEIKILNTVNSAVTRARWYGYDPVYFDYLRRSKIIVTCNPSTWEGDMRTWEALSQGGLVFVDRMYDQIGLPLIDGEHCIIYDINEKGLKILADKIRYYADNESEASAIGEAGKDFVLKNHRSRDRVIYIINNILRGL